MVQFIPGTALPTNVDEAGSGEGRGEPSFLPSRIPGPSLFEKLGDRDDITPSELAVITAALRVYDQRPKKERTVDNTVGADWDNVQLSLVAGAPQSFIQPLSQPLYARRPEIPIIRMRMVCDAHPSPRGRGPAAVMSRGRRH